MIWQRGLLMLLFSAVSFGSAAVSVYLSAGIANKLGEKLREKVFKKVASFSQKEMDHFGASSLITRNTNDVTQVQNLVEMALKFIIIAPIYLFGGLYFSYRLDARLTLIFISVTPLLLLACLLTFRYANPLFEKVQGKIDQLNLIFKEGLTGIQVIQAFNKEETEYKRYEKENDIYTKLAIRSNVLVSFLIPFMTLVMSVATVVITWLGAKDINVGQMEIGTMIGVISYAGQILSGIGILTMVISFIPRGQTSAKRINEVLEYQNEIQDGENQLQINQTEKNQLVLEDVTFRYDEAEENTIDHFSFSVQSEEVLAIIGSTGAGKTTLINLLDRLYDPTDGAILFNNQKINQITQTKWHEQVSLVPQMNQLFSRTIRENLRIGNEQASDKELWQALKLAEAADFVEASGGLDGLVEKNGGNFSGGQKQRLCLARAFIKKAPIYLFDDSFSGLDFKTDAKIQRNIRNGLKKSIKIIVAQRITTVKNATHIAVINEGKLVGFGSHEELKQNNSVYQEIILSQMEAVE
ncbi:ABC transporter [Enterococcus silesiacus]|uniref:ABC transporter n=1 Tax=Enterococcus silesiacus TaxID=332949 RepID=A0AA91JNC4_9ENTE|nr:ABC transporter [Enterococcus silesiacus]